MSFASFELNFVVECEGVAERRIIMMGPGDCWRRGKNLQLSTWHNNQIISSWFSVFSSKDGKSLCSMWVFTWNDVHHDENVVLEFILISSHCVECWDEVERENVIIFFIAFSDSPQNCKLRWKILTLCSVRLQFESYVIAWSTWLTQTGRYLKCVYC